MNTPKEISSFYSTLRDWVGDGLRPVDNERAEVRARICVACPMHAKDNWWFTFKSAVADEIRKQVALKNKMDVRTSADHLLGECRGCGCVMLLKVHVPINHIEANTDDETMKAFHKNCWITSEIRELKEISK